MTSTPAEINMKNLNASFTMNKSLSDSAGPMLKMQGVGWAIRTAAEYSTVTLNMKQHTNDAGFSQLDQEQVATGGITSTEERTLTGEVTEKDNKLWGKVKGYSKFGDFASLKNSHPDIAEKEEEWLREDWDEETLSGNVVETFSESLEKGWTALSIWGFANIGQNGAAPIRRHTRKVLCKSKDKSEVFKVKLVYDYKP